MMAGGERYPQLIKMSADIQVEDGKQDKPACSGSACLKKQAGMCKKDRLGLRDDTERKAVPVAIPRVERRSKLRQLLIQEKGQSLIEFALTVPFLLLVVTGIASFGVAFNNYMMLTEATSVGARQLTVSRGQTLDPCRTFSSAVYAAAPMLKQASLTFTISLNGNPYPGATCASQSTTTGAAGNMILGTNAIVTVTYPVSVTVYGFKVVPTNTLTAQTTELMQ